MTTTVSVSHSGTNLRVTIGKTIYPIDFQIVNLLYNPCEADKLLAGLSDTILEDQFGFISSYSVGGLFQYRKDLVLLPKTVKRDAVIEVKFPSLGILTKSIIRLAGPVMPMVESMVVERLNNIAGALGSEHIYVSSLSATPADPDLNLNINEVFHLVKPYRVVSCGGKGEVQIKGDKGWHELPNDYATCTFLSYLVSANLDDSCTVWVCNAAKELIVNHELNSQVIVDMNDVLDCYLYEATYDQLINWVKVAIQRYRDAEKPKASYPFGQA